MKNYRIILVALFASMVVSVSAQHNYGRINIHNTTKVKLAEQDQQRMMGFSAGRNVNVLPISSFAHEKRFTSSRGVAAFKSTGTVFSSSPSLSSSSLSAGTFVSADDYLRSISPSIRKGPGVPDGGIENPDPDKDGLVPLSGGVWFILILAIGYAVLQFHRKRSISDVGKMDR